MAVLMHMPEEWNPQAWRERLARELPDHAVMLTSEPHDRASIRYACVWRPPEGLLAGLPALAVIFSLGAGVDHILGDPGLPDRPLVRIIDPDLTARMSEYVVLHVLRHHRRQPLYEAQQRRHQWIEHPQPAAAQVRVGIMGLGELGRDAAIKLRTIGFDVAGWSRTEKHVAGVASYHGESGLEGFLARTEILVVLLPLTAATRGILNARLFAGLARDGVLGAPVLINAGRGELQIERDVLHALDAGILGAATLDVFQTEPLPATSPLWDHPKVTITPHNAAVSSPRALAARIASAIRDFEAGRPLQGLVSRDRGY